MEEKIKQIEKFKELLLSTNREGIRVLIHDLQGVGFFDCPASAKFHGNYKGGLLDHSINLYNEFRAVCKIFDLKIPNESIIIACLLHDVCKIGLYVGDGAPFGYNRFADFKNHGKKSIIFLKKYII
jgi:23S rRNA maturation-related 3'-5' exoribonuclease YhaM